MEIKLLNQDQLIRTAQGFLHHPCGYVDNTELRGGKIINDYPGTFYSGHRRLKEVLYACNWNIPAILSLKKAVCTN